MLRARREHPVRLEAALGDQVVHENADVALVAAEFERRFGRARARGIDARDNALRGRFFVAGRAVDLPGEKEPSTRFVSRRAVSSVGWMKSYSTA